MRTKTSGPSLKKGEYVDLIVNGKVVKVRQEHLAGTILGMFIPQLGLMSFDGVCTCLENTVALLNEIGVSGTTRTKAGYMEKLVESARARFSSAEDAIAQEKIARGLDYALSEIVLRNEGMGTLAGFGYAKIDCVEGRRRVSGHYTIDPEKVLTNTITY